MIVPYLLTTTRDILTSKAGLLTLATLLETLQLGERFDNNMPLPKTERGFLPSEYLHTFILMMHNGDFHFDDVHRLHEESDLCGVLGLERIPGPSALGQWLRTQAQQHPIHDALIKINKVLLQSALHHCNAVTLDIDATEVVANKKAAKWSYNKNKGYMPMVGHIAETGQVVACDFREGNTPPSKDNFAFIQQCEAQLPDNCRVKAVRIDAAGYQINIIKYCDEQQIEYAIRARMCSAIKEHIATLNDEDWQPLNDKHGNATQQQTCRTVHTIGDYEKAFTLIIQRKEKKGQSELDLCEAQTSDETVIQGYVYRAIATNIENKSDSDIIHWYNQRGEDSENRIKELKSDFGGGTLPCSDFNANALYFNLCALSYNIFALMRQLLPEKLSKHRAPTIRYRLYAMAAKIVKTGRQWFIKLQASHLELLQEVLAALGRLEPPTI